MQCVACRAFFSDSLDHCPQCQTPVASQKAELSGEERKEEKRSSTLIEFPRAARTQQPAWRKELSARVREIQERRAREATRAAEGHRAHPTLGVVTRSDPTPTNPIVAAALRRLERARQQPPVTRRASGGAATALARAEEPQVEAKLEKEREEKPPRPEALKRELEQISDVEKKREEKPSRPEAPPRPIPLAQRERKPLRQEPERARPSPLQNGRPSSQSSRSSPPPRTAEATGKAKAVEVASESRTPSTSAPNANRTEPRRVFNEVVDDALLARLEAEREAQQRIASVRQMIDDRAPFAARLMAATIDLLIIAFFSSPFAAIIEITSSDWSDPRVRGSMLGILLVLTFLYFAASVTLAGRTCGMKLVSIRVVDVRTGMVPTLGQSARRALALMLSPITFGLTFLYALGNAEGRAVHDLLSGTIVVRE
ncbi:MAG: RDD family protein [Pyrinomonas methylaliphatogenes]|nr:RDD family protein [Pyrinomonas methylaliphatogenes]